MYAIALSLGHNASAILLQDGNVLIGYEEERLSGIKSDSRFPIKALEEIGKYYDLDQVDTVTVSHWDTYGNIDNMGAKYWKRDVLTAMCPNAVLWSHDQVFTHHDAHMLVANAYSGLKKWTIVADGFGNYNEVLSIYHGDNLVHRAFGYEKSLGLLYQYATAFLGMKMNQDEYKLLGYESHIDELSSDKVNIINKHIDRFTKTYTKKLLSHDIQPNFDALCNVSALPALRGHLSRKFAECVRELKPPSQYEKRVAIAYFVQSVVENTLLSIVRHYGINEVTLVGGVFYNVKLNNAIMNEVQRISVCPLAGDQGAGLGVYEYYHGDLKFPKDLCIGRRDLSGFSYATGWNNLKVCKNTSEAIRIINKALAADKIVNVVKGSMEFGPRALGNTTTLFPPSSDNVDYVNHLNGRSTVMPCAPITIDIDQFVGHSKVINSLAHMIITLDYKNTPPASLMGAAHKYPFVDKYSGRPQLIDKSNWLYPVMNKFGTLVNTSFNKHGSPILFSEDQIMESYKFQYERDHEGRMLTVIVLD